MTGAGPKQGELQGHPGQAAGAGHVLVSSGVMLILIVSLKDSCQTNWWF